jgi:predicted Fe-S protein YdhL (DUF1289 family)
MSLGAAKLIRDRAAELEPDGYVPSPCICVCTMDPATGLCIGCYRTLDEIADWSAMDDTEKRAVWQRLLERVGPE